MSKRVGKKGRVFHCAKFRTTAHNITALLEDAQMGAWRSDMQSKRDLHITRVGRFLRRYSLDELPVLFSILKGDMSVVGPRAPSPNELADCELSYLRRLDLSPGLTGLWQIQGRHDRSSTCPESLNEAYAEEPSIWLDLKIIVRTMKMVLLGED
jgi:lipopolysaccharide/colanic/teichoic acid biosynthesis glycosyltransferase